MFYLFCRSTDDPKYFKPECTAVSQRVIDEAIDWLWTLDRTASVGSTSACEAVMKALDDQQVKGSGQLEITGGQLKS